MEFHLDKDKAFKKAKILFQTGDLDRAEYFFLSLLENSEESEVYFYLGLISNQKRQYEKALLNFYRSVEKNPDYGSPCNEIGVILLRMGKDKESIFWLKKSVRCKTNEALHIPLYNLATLYKIWNRPERSLQYLHKAIELNPNFSEAIRLRAEILSKI
ncbi:MAG: hypothetical protein L6Q54_02500 [Leptospiraceae bacterium]|nr:hypothetical protein [Leptospiraceae bacterium]MCK6380109.1 hypothetical protein [Leptospiraceae bacterium]